VLQASAQLETHRYPSADTAHDPIRRTIMRNPFRSKQPIRDTRHPAWENELEEVRQAHEQLAEAHAHAILESYKSGNREEGELPHSVPTDEAVPVSMVIDYLLTLASEDSTRSITIANLPTLLYYCQGHYLASAGKPLFSDDLLTLKGKDFKMRSLQVEVVEKRYRRTSEVVRKLTGKYPSLRPAHRTVIDEQALRDQEDAGVTLGGLSRLQRSAVGNVWRMYRDYSPNYLEFNFKQEINDGSCAFHGERPHEWKRNHFTTDTVDLEWIRDNFSPLYDFDGSLLHQPKEQ
jgi:uncharacterized phage-associated protein